MDIDATHTKVCAYLGANSDCAKSLFIGKSWLGKVLAELGTDNPYPVANDIKSIPPTQEVADVNLYQFNLLGDLEKVNELRKVIGLISDEVASLDFKESVIIKNARMLAIAKTQSYVHLAEARFELGKKLSSLRNN